MPLIFSHSPGYPDLPSWSDTRIDWLTLLVWTGAAVGGIAFYLWVGAWLWGLGDIPRTL